MSDINDSTLSSTAEAVEYFLSSHTPEEGVASDVLLREQARTLALGVAYGWSTRDPQAQEAFLDDLLGLPHDLGVTFAVEVFTEIRLFGLQVGSLRPGTEVTTSWSPAEDPAIRPADRSVEPVRTVDAAQAARHRECVEIITDLWSGLGSWDSERATLARARMARLPRWHVRELLRIMAYDAYVAMERFAEWQSIGSDAVEDYRLNHPDDYQVAPGLRTEP